LWDLKTKSPDSYFLLDLCKLGYLTHISNASLGETVFHNNLCNLFNRLSLWFEKMDMWVSILGIHQILWGLDMKFYLWSIDQFSIDYLCSKFDSKTTQMSLCLNVWICTLGLSWDLCCTSLKTGVVKKRWRVTCEERDGLSSTRKRYSDYYWDCIVQNTVIVTVAVTTSKLISRSMQMFSH
jgi:hypothetical protein